MKKTNKFQLGDYVFVKPFEELCKINNISPNNENYKKHIDYMHSKGSLHIHYIYAPGELTYSAETEPTHLRGKKTECYYYNMHTPRSKMYLFREDELILDETKERNPKP